MNKLFKVIWSKSKQCYIVVSEVAKNTTGKKKIAVASVLAALTVGAQVATVQAAIPEGNASNGAALAIGNNVNVSNDSSTGLGKDIEVTRRFAVAVGFGVKATADNAVAIGSGARFGTIQANGNDSIAIGTRAEAGMQSSIAIGRLSRAVTGEKGVAIGNEAVTTALSAIAIGNKVNATKDTAISIGNESNATGTAAAAYGNKAQATADSTVAVGDGSKATGANATAVGKSSEASQDSALAAGNGASATAAGAIATGKSASATGVQSIAIGSSGADANEAPAASGTQSIAIGTKTVANSGNAVAIGSEAKATGVSAVSIGLSTVAKEQGATAIGTNVKVETNKAVGIGFDINVRKAGATNIGYKSDNDANQAVAIGARNSVAADAQYGTAVGYFTRVTAKNAVAIGSSNDNNGNSDEGKVLASAESAVAIGTSAHAEATSAVAIGTKAKAQLAHSVALGEGSTTTDADGNATTGYLTNDAVNNTGNGVVSVGNGGSILRRITSVASGTNDNDAINVKQLKALRNASLSTISVVNGATSTDLVPNTTEGAADANKVKLVAGKNITLTANGNSVTIDAKGGASSITSANNDAISIDTSADGKVSVTPNLATDVNAAGDANKLVTAGKVKEALADKVSTAKLNEELGKKANAADVAGLTTNKLDKTAELHVKKGTYAVADDGSVTLDKADGTGTVKSDEAVKITGLASKTALDNLKTEVDKKASKTDLDTKIGEVNAELATKVSNDTFRDEMAKKADLKAINDLKDVLAGKVDTAALDKIVAAMGNKVDETELNERLKAEKAENAAALKKAVDAAKATSDTGVSELKAGKLDKTAELHVVKGEYEVDTEGNVTLKKANGENTEVADENVVIKGVASKAKLKDVADKVTAAEGDIATLKEGVKENKDGLAGLTTKVDDVKATADKAKDDLGKLTTKVNTLDGKVAEHDTKLEEVGNKIDGIKQDIANNLATNDAVNKKLDNLKTELGTNTVLHFAGDKTIDDKGTADDTADDDNSASKLSLNLKDQTLKVKGTTGEIETTAKGDTITVGLSDKVKEDLAKIAKLGDTTADGRDGANGTAKDTGLTGQDGLNGKTLTDKVNALRNGEAGSVVYTDADGKRLVKANDGKYYLAKDVDEDGNKVGSAKAVEGDNLKASVVNPDGSTNPTTLSNLKDGKIAAGSKDAVTGNQLHAAKAEVAKYLGGGATVDENGNVTEPTFTVKDKDNKDVQAHTVGDALSTMNERLNNASSAAAADIKQLKDMDGLSDKGKNAIKDLAKDAVDVKGDKNITVTSTMENGVKTFHATLSERITLGGHDPKNPDADHSGDPGVEIDGHEGTVTAGNGVNEVKMNGADGTITAGNGENGNKVTIDGKDGSVTAKKGEFGAPLDKDGKFANEKSHTTIDDKGLSTVYKDKDGKESKVEIEKGRLTAGAPVNEKGEPKEAGTATAMDKDNGFSVTSKDKDGNVSTVGINNGRVSAGDPVDENGIPKAAGSATSMDKDGFSLATKDKDGKVSKVDIKNGGITAGAPVDANGIPTEKNSTAVSMGKDGFSVISTDENGKVLTPITIKNGKISGLQPGTADTDVATVGQVKEAIGKTAEVLEKTAQRVDQVGAHSAALAALNPLSYDPLRKSQIMAGVGTYSGNQALALGLAHYANENLMVTAGFTMGSGKSMANLGATYRFGSGEHDDLPERYKGGPISSVYVMQDEVTALKAENAEMKDQIKMLMQRIEMLASK